MEKSIDERARLANPYEKEHYDSPYEINIADKYAEGYKDGATDQDPISRADQKKIDTEKACLLCEKQLKGILGNTKEAHRLAYEDFKRALENEIWKQ